MVGALLADARPTGIESGRLAVSFPAAAAFSKKKAEANRELLHTAIKGLTGQALALDYELSGDAEPEADPTLTEDELLERLKAEFGASEVFDDDKD